MIKRTELLRVGQFNKPHGVKGDLSFACKHSSWELDKATFLLCELDGIMVPFRVEAFRQKVGGNAYIKLKGFDSDNKARLFNNLDVYVSKENLAESEISQVSGWEDIIGFEVFDRELGSLGLIKDVDESTMNVLLVVENEFGEVLIPAVSEIVLDIDKDKKHLQVLLPEGLIDL
ncbi:ribosome maturation factor RimM [Bacteroidales bacterium]|nr:ribosome maturation factor RimM [Bacteroidales bacterium]